MIQRADTVEPEFEIEAEEIPPQSLANFDPLPTLAIDAFDFQRSELELRRLADCVHHVSGKKQFTRLDLSGFINSGSVSQFAKALTSQNRGIKYQQVFVWGHSNGRDVYGDDPRRGLSLMKLARALHEASVLEDDAIYFAGYCQGGLETSAFPILQHAPEVCAVIGPKEKVGGTVLVQAFTSILDSRQVYRIDLEKAVKEVGKRNEFLLHHRDLLQSKRARNLVLGAQRSGLFQEEDA